MFQKNQLFLRYCLDFLPTSDVRCTHIFLEILFNKNPKHFSQLST